MVTISSTRAAEAKKRRKRGRPKALSDDAQRAIIVATAWRLFVKKGFTNTTTDDVAAAAHISKQTLYRLFPSKQALFAAVVDTHRQAMLALPGNYENMPIKQALELIFRTNIDQRAHQDRLALFKILLSEAEQSPALRRIARKHGAAPSRAELAKWLSEQQKRGRIAIDNPNTCARILLDMTIGSVVHSMNIERKGSSLSEFQDHIRHAIAVFLNGVLPR